MIVKDSVFQGLLDCSQKGLEPVHRPLQSPQLGLTSVRLLPVHGRARLFLDPLAYGTGSQSSCKGILMEAKLLLLGERHKRGGSYSAIKLTSLPKQQPCISQQAEQFKNRKL